MVPTIDVISSALWTVMTWPTIGFIVLGTLIGILFGAIPGLGATIAIILLIPITFGLNAAQAMPLFLAVLGGVSFGGSISAILIDTPGTPPNAATVLDGHPMAKQGRSSEALGISAVASALGAVFGLIVLTLLIPFARELIFAFGPPEFFWLVITGVVLITTIGRGNKYKGLAVGGLGMILAFVGYSGLFGTVRYDLGMAYLWAGFKPLVVLIGLFAIAEAIKLTIEEGTIATGDIREVSEDSAITGAVQVLRRPRLLLQSGAIGTIVGMIPGAGGVVSTFMSYTQAARISSNPDSFGKGNPEGVIASEAANDSKDGGGLLPTLVFGIPGGVVGVAILSALQIHGLSPGRELLTQELDILYLMILALLMANVLTSTFGIIFADHLAVLTYIPVKLIVPGILVLSLTSAYTINGSFSDIIVAVAFGVIGYVMIAFDFSRIALVIGLILGDLAERSFFQSIQISDGSLWIFFDRTPSQILIIILVVSLAYPYIRSQIDTYSSES